MSGRDVGGGYLWDGEIVCGGVGVRRVGQLSPLGTGWRRAEDGLRWHMIDFAGMGLLKVGEGRK